MQIGNRSIPLKEENILRQGAGLIGTDGMPVFFIGLNPQPFDQAFKDKDIIGSTLHVQKLKAKTQCFIVFSIITDDGISQSQPFDVQFNTGEITLINRYLELIWQIYATGNAQRIA